MTDLAVQPIAFAEPVHAPPLASWTRRVVATFLDGAIFTGTTWLVLGAAAGGPSLTPGTSSDPGSGAADAVSWVSSPWLVGLVVVMLALQGYTGATPGKRVAGVAIVRTTDGRPTGLFAAAARVVAHLLDAIFLVGYLRPLWNAKGQTFADSIVGTLAVQTREPAAHPWFARFRHGPSARRSTAVSVAAWAVCVLGAGFTTTTYGTGSTSDESLPCRTAAVPATPSATATATLETNQHVERRLWITRESTEPGALRITWTVDDPGGSAAGVQVETDVVDASGSIATTDSSTPAVIRADAGRTVLDAATVEGAELARVGPGWTANARLLVDGKVVAACTVDGSGWTVGG